MAVKIAPDARRQFVNASGVPYSGAKLFYYAAGSSTKQNTYTTSAGNVANTNPIILDSAGRTPYGVWFTSGLTYKEVLAPSTDTDPPGSPIFTEDNLSGVNDTSVSASQWIASALTPTYISSTQFSVVGDQTTELHVGRRLQLTVTAGTVYGRISVTAYTTLTTVTLVMDSGQSLDSGLSSFNWSILSAVNPPIPKLTGTLWDGLGLVNNDSTQTIAGNKTLSGNNVHSGADSFTNTVDFTAASILGATPLVFEGATVNANKISISITDPTASRTITVPDASVDLTKVRAASTTLDGVSRFSTTSEAQAGSSATIGVTPAGLGATVLGLGQSFSDVTGSRASGVTYTNSTGRSIVVSVWATTGGTTNQTAACYVAGVQIANNSWYANGAGYTANAYFLVPPGATYSITFTNVSSITKWYELR